MSDRERVDHFSFNEFIIFNESCPLYIPIVSDVAIVELIDFFPFFNQSADNSSCSESLYGES